MLKSAIALSIAYVAIENVLTQTLKPWRIGLVLRVRAGARHGLRRVLKDLGLPRREFLPALLSFNAGVEAAQIAVLLAAYLAFGRWAGSRTWYRQRVVIPASLAIAAVALRWTFQRLAL